MKFEKEDNLLKDNAVGNENLFLDLGVITSHRDVIVDNQKCILLENETHIIRYIKLIKVILLMTNQLRWYPSEI